MKKLLYIIFEIIICTSLYAQEKLELFRESKAIENYHLVEILHSSETDFTCLYERGLVKNVAGFVVANLGEFALRVYNLNGEMIRNVKLQIQVKKDISHEEVVLLGEQFIWLYTFKDDNKIHFRTIDQRSLDVSSERELLDINGNRFTTFVSENKKNLVILDPNGFDVYSFNEEVDENWRSSLSELNNQDFYSSDGSTNIEIEDVLVSETGAFYMSTAYNLTPMNPKKSFALKHSKRHILAFDKDGNQKDILIDLGDRLARSMRLTEREDGTICFAGIYNTTSWMGTRGVFYGYLDEKMNTILEISAFSKQLVEADRTSTHKPSGASSNLEYKYFYIVDYKSTGDNNTTLIIDKHTSSDMYSVGRFSMFIYQFNTTNDIEWSTKIFKETVFATPKIIAPKVMVSNEGNLNICYVEHERSWNQSESGSKAKGSKKNGLVVNAKMNSAGEVEKSIIYSTSTMKDAMVPEYTFQCEDGSMILYHPTFGNGFKLVKEQYGILVP